MAVRRFSAKQQRQHKQRVMLVCSFLFFAATTGFNVANFFKSTLNPPQASAANQSTTTTAVDPVQQEIKGYEQVLQREPNNQAALEGLVNARLKMNDAAGAIEPLEKLVQLHPERTDYATLLDKIRSLAATPATTP